MGRRDEQIARGAKAMKFLLDTHTLIWALVSPDRLSRKARGVIENRENELWVSSSSVWEIFIKFALGKMPECRALCEDLEAHLARLGTVELPIHHAHAVRAATIRHAHRDPFDRMLAAQSAVESLPVVTRDPMIRALGAKTIW